MKKDDQNILDAELEKLKQDFEELKTQNQEYLSGWQRALADYSNFQREMEKRQKDMIEYANAATVLDILPIYNNLKLALRHAKDDQKENDFIKGIEQIKKQFMDLLKGFKVEEIKTIGEKFDPNFHEAVECAEVEGCATGIIYDEVSSGYMMNEKVIEPAKVKVAK
ncbi:MAG: nucleotide exchange factor GrpE [Candidatus Buchananbacteria bacterium]